MLLPRIIRFAPDTGKEPANKNRKRLQKMGRSIL